MSSQTTNPFLIAEARDEPAESVAPGRSNGDSPVERKRDGRTPIVIDETPGQLHSNLHPQTVANGAGLRRPRPLADRVSTLQSRLRAGRWLAPVGIVAVVAVVLVLALSPLSGTAPDSRLVSARRSIAALQASNTRLWSEVRTLSAENRALQGHLTSGRARPKPVQAQPHPAGKPNKGR